MKIVFLSFYSGFVSRGVETFVYELAKRLIKKHKVLIVQAGPVKFSSPAWQNFQVKRIKIKMKWPGVDSKGFKRKWMIDYYYRKISWFTLRSLPAIIKFKPDVIVPTNGGWQVFLIKLYTLFTKSKMIISGQAGLGRNEKWNLLLKPDIYVALSKRNAAWTKKHSSGVRIKIIPNGVDLNKFKMKNEKLKIKIQNLKLRRPIILCVAGHERYKRVEETIRAVALLKGASLLVAGGSEKTKILGKKLLKDRFGQLKFNYEGMPKVYRAADLFTLVSESSEAFGISYLEAMACGLPVVATDDKLRREIVGRAGLFIKNPENSKIYVQKLQQALGRSWGDLPREQAKKFSWEKVVASYENLLKELT